MSATVPVREVKIAWTISKMDDTGFGEYMAKYAKGITGKRPPSFSLGTLNRGRVQGKQIDEGLGKVQRDVLSPPYMK